MIRREEGFSLVELLVTMVVFVLILTATSNTFIGLLKDFKKQSTLSETNIEGAFGLETLRRDITSAGYGLPWGVDGAAWTDLTAYLEAASDLTAGAPPDPASFNDAPPVYGSRRAPRAIVVGNNNGVDFSTPAVVGEASDYLVIKAINVAINPAAQKWTHLRAGDAKTTWTPRCENVNEYPTSADKDCSGAPSDNNAVRVIVINPGGTGTSQRLLKVDAGNIFFKQYSATADLDPAAGSTDVYVIYGVDDNDDLRMPFNRADYFIERPSSDLSSTCADNTGVLYKATVNQNGGDLDKVPILDCVADMQVAFGLDMNEDGTMGTYATSDGNSIQSTEAGIDQAAIVATFGDAALLRQRLKEVGVWILAHEGERDTSYQSRQTILVGPAVTFGRNFNVGANRNYRWKIYTLVLKMENLK